MAAYLLKKVTDVNVRAPTSGRSALHFVALYNAVAFLSRLEARADLNFCVRDLAGNTASHIAWVIAGNEPLGAVLMEKEILYARAHSIAWRPPIGS